MILLIENERTYIQGADQFILDWLGKELRYTVVDSEFLAGERDPLLQANTWDGWVRLLRRPKTKLPWFPTGLLSLVERLIRKYRYEYSISDRRVRPKEGFPELVKIPLRDYQRKAVERAIKEGRGVLDMVPRSGKTRIACEIQRQIALPAVWIVPTDGIARQTKNVLDGLFYEAYSYHLVGSVQDKLQIAKDVSVVVCTAATAVSLPQEFYNSRECIIVDEFHHAAAKSYNTIFEKCAHIYFRFGMTGTFMRSSGDDMAMHAHLSKTIYRITSADLLQYGFLVPTKVVFLPITQRMPRSDRGPMPTSFFTGHGKYGIHEFQYRNDLVSQCTYWLCQYGYKVLVLVGTKKQGRLLQSSISKYLPVNKGTEFKVAEFISTDMRRDIQARIITAFLETQEIRVLLGTTILGEGIDLPSVDALVYARGEKAEVSLTQSIYRTCTAVEGKTHAVVVDFADRHNRKLLKHSQERLEVYFKEPIFEVDILDDVSQFNQWLARVPVSQARCAGEPK
jgi:superfamily II DNA or RNA helicase